MLLHTVCPGLGLSCVFMTDEFELLRAMDFTPWNYFIGSSHRYFRKRVENITGKRQESKPSEWSSVAKLPKMVAIIFDNMHSCFSAEKSALAEKADTIEARTWKLRPWVGVRSSVNSYGVVFKHSS